MLDLTALRDRLKVTLSQPPKEDEPSVSQLAQMVKELQASQVIESTTERSESKAVSAEEPVTARIRQQMSGFERDDGLTARACETGSRSLLR